MNVTNVISGIIGGITGTVLVCAWIIWMSGR